MDDSLGLRLVCECWRLVASRSELAEPEPEAPVAANIADIGRSWPPLSSLEARSSKLKARHKLSIERRRCARRCAMSDVRGLQLAAQASSLSQQLTCATRFVSLAEPAAK